MFRASEFKSKEVINVTDGERLGFVYDLEIDAQTGHIRAIIVPGRERPRLFSKTEGLVIPWQCIRKLGEDIILVDTQTG